MFLKACADPGFFSGGGGVQAGGSENGLGNIFWGGGFSSQLILQFTEGVQWFYYRENYTFPRIQRGPIIFKGSNFFPGGV